ncbi:complex I assembly factor ACAD9, mitochondrial-like [Adelges cooleyi]|uniref:complex I assembly factor ACAD9, mitochondrial-like n=1 Tax=Adelges cooleyi TaxID=133065 RepID=UPI00217FD328|nr:complex I assembly factor ACAD9, mitochondrial-like [Adelges cooleyi]
MLLCKLNWGIISRMYHATTPVAAAASATVSNIRPDAFYSINTENPPLAKSFYVGIFNTNVFNLKVKATEVLSSSNLFGVKVPKHFGGTELSVTEISNAFKAIGLKNYKHYLAHGSVVQCITKHGSDEQKTKFLPLLASGENVATFCAYESQHGYDVENTSTKASFINGKWVINGTKSWVVNAKKSDVLLVLAKTMDECNRPESKMEFFSAFLVKKSSNGVKIIDNGSYSDVIFDNVQVDSMLGLENEGLLCHSILFTADFIESASATVGELKKITKSFSEDFITNNQLKLLKLGKINSILYSMDCVLHFTSLILDSYKTETEYEQILARIFVTESTYACLDLLNDLGLPKTAYSYIEDSLLFDGRGTLLSIVGSLLGIQHAGQFMANEVKQLRNPLMFPKYTLSHIAKIQSSLKDKPKLKQYIERYLHPSLKKQALDLEYCLSRIQFAVQNMFINLGPDTCHYQMILERINSVALNTYAMSAILHNVSGHLSSKNSQIYPTELVHASVFCNNARAHCSKTVTEILDAPNNVTDPLYKLLGQQIFVDKDYYLEHPLKRNIV